MEIMIYIQICKRLPKKNQIVSEMFRKSFKYIYFFRKLIECFQTSSEGEFGIPKIFGNSF